MTTLARRRIRIAADAAWKTDEPMIDLAAADANATPELWRGNDLQVEVGFFQDATLLDISNIASVILNVKPTSDRDGTPLMTATLEAADLDATLAANTWTDGTKQHALFTFTAAETNISLDSSDDRECWLAIGITTNDSPGRTITIAYTVLKVVEDGIGGEGVPQANEHLHYTKAESDARYPQKHEDQAWTRWANGRWYHYIQSTALWYPEVAIIKDAVPILTLGEGVSEP